MGAPKDRKQKKGADCSAPEIATLWILAPDYSIRGRALRGDDVRAKARALRGRA